MSAVFAALISTFAAALTAQPVAPAPPASAPPAVAAPAPTVEPAPLTPEAEVAQMKMIYEQSCTTRIYGTYDDVCSGLADQIRAVEAQVRRDRRRQAKPSS